MTNFYSTVSDEPVKRNPWEALHLHKQFGLFRYNTQSTLHFLNVQALQSGTNISLPTLCQRILLPTKLENHSGLRSAEIVSTLKLQL